MLGRWHLDVIGATGSALDPNVVLGEVGVPHVVLDIALFLGGDPLCEFR